jgi:FMN-dependent NADH-azoreductase
MKKLLFANACVNRQMSRTYRIGEAFVSLLKSNGDYDVTELVLENEDMPALVSETLNKRLDLLAKGDFANETLAYARQFADADCIVAAAPYWNFGFPAILKTYIEAVSVPGIVYKYGEDGSTTGLCKANALYYITTRGGFIGDEKDLGYATMAQFAAFCGIKKINCISADGLDIPINNADAIVARAIDALPDMVTSDLK